MMGFFNEDFYKELDKNIDLEDEEVEAEEFEFEDLEDDEIDFDSTDYADNVGLEVNKNNKEKFKNIMNNAVAKFDYYWDINNPVIRFILAILFTIIAVGLIYYIIGWFTILK